MNSYVTFHKQNIDLPTSSFIQKNVHKALLAAIFILVSSVPALAQSEGEIRGQVTAREGTRLLGATISLDGKAVTATDVNGNFRIRNVSIGAHSLAISYISYATFETSITMASGKVEYVEVVLDELPTQTEIVTITASRTPYRASLSSTATKTTTSLLETPASVEIVTAERLEKARVDRVDEAFDYMTGVVRGGATRAQGYLLRGIEVDNRFIPYQVDGISGGVWRQHEPPAAIIDRIEYLKGPASVLYGITQLGGVINYITKRPQASPAASIEMRHTTFATDVSPFGADNSLSITADMTGPLADSGRLMYRLIANHMNTKSYRQDVEESSIDVLPAVTWAPSDRTSITASLNLNVDKGRWDEFLPVPKGDLSKLPSIDTRVNEPQDYYWDYGWGIGYIFRHNLSDSWTIRSTGRTTNRIDGRRLFESVRLLNDSILSRRWRDQFNQRVYSYVDVTSEKGLTTGSIEHTLLVGVTLGIEDIHFDRRNMQGDSTLNINIYNPQHEAAPILPPKPDYNRFWDNTVFGAYVQDQVTLIDQLQLVAGAQYISESTTHERRDKNLVFDKYDAGFLPRVGLVFLPLENLSVYGSYSTSFSPTNAEQENAEGNIDFEPEFGTQIEAGLKFNLFNSKLGGSAAFFTLNRKNALNPTDEQNANGNTIYVQTGVVRNVGLEIDLYASPIDGLFLSGGYAMNDATVVEDVVPENVDARLAYVPKGTYNLWGSYRFGDAIASGLEIGVGMVHVDERPVALAREGVTTLFLPAYTRFDGFISWRVLPRTTLALNVNNLTDELYFSSGASLRIVPGLPRSVRTTLKMEF